MKKGEEVGVAREKPRIGFVAPRLVMHFEDDDNRDVDRERDQRHHFVADFAFAHFVATTNLPILVRLG